VLPFCRASGLIRILHGRWRVARFAVQAEQSQCRHLATEQIVYASNRSDLTLYCLSPCRAETLPADSLVKRGVLSLYFVAAGAALLSLCGLLSHRDRSETLLRQAGFRSKNKFRRGCGKNWKLADLPCRIG
jgi:hypothetical protein